MNLRAARHLLFDLLGPRTPYLLLDPELPSAFDYRPFRRVLTLREASTASILDGAAFVQLAHGHHLGRPPYRQVPGHLRPAYDEIRGIIERRLHEIEDPALDAAPAGQRALAEATG